MKNNHESHLSDKDESEVHLEASVPDASELTSEVAVEVTVDDTQLGSLLMFGDEKLGNQAAVSTPLGGVETATWFPKFS